jgi:glycogen synthase
VFSAVQVWMVPSFSDQERLLLLAACNAVVYTPQNEHFGIVPLEAMAAARPVVACSSGGPLESVVDGETGFLCDPTPSAFAAAMHKLAVHSTSLPLSCTFLSDVWHTSSELEHQCNFAIHRSNEQVGRWC